MVRTRRNADNGDSPPGGRSALIAKVLISFTALGFGIGPLVMDLSPSHAFNEEWPPHARLHMVYLIGMQAFLAVVVLVLTWRKRTRTGVPDLRLAAVLGWAALIPFGIAVATRPVYGGGLVAGPSAPEVFGIESNLFGFSLASAAQAIATFIVFRRG